MMAHADPQWRASPTIAVHQKFRLVKREIEAYFLLLDLEGAGSKGKEELSAVVSRHASWFNKSFSLPLEERSLIGVALNF